MVTFVIHDGSFLACVSFLHQFAIQVRNMQKVAISFDLWQNVFLFQIFLRIFEFGFGIQIDSLTAIGAFDQAFWSKLVQHARGVAWLGWASLGYVGLGLAGRQ